MNDPIVKDGKTIAIISYLTIIGLLVAFIMNINKQNSFASFHIRQSVGIFLLAFLINILFKFSNSFGMIGGILSIGLFVLWIFGIAGAIQGQEKRIPLLGDQFQEWFKNIR